MSASHTGEVLFLSHCRTGPRNVFSAILPAARTASVIRAVSSAGGGPGRPLSASGNGEALHPHGRRIGAAAELEVVCRRERGVHVDEVAGDRDLAHREGLLPVLNPKTARAAAVVAGDPVDPEAN